jgi:hypothetical protein
MICASEGQLAQVSDLLMGSTLKDFDFDDSDASSRLITLDCKHVFSVETLDGLFKLEQFYSRDAEGNWIGRLYPDFDGADPLTPPTCPLCRKAISSKYARRYGRSIKSAFVSSSS